MAYKIQHLTLGGVLDQAIAITKDHFGLLFGIMLCGIVPLHLISGFLGLQVMPAEPGAPPMEGMQASPMVLLSLAVLGIFGNLFVVPLTNAAVINAVARLYLGQSTSATASFRYALSRFLPLLGTTILYGMAIMGGLILLIIPGILFALWFGLCQHVVVIEGISGQAALGRSKKLVRPHLGAFLILGFVMFFISVMMGAAAEFIPQPHLRVVASALLTAVITIFWTAAGVVFYFSCRCAVENFDLEYLAEAIGTNTAETGAGDVNPDLSS